MDLLHLLCWFNSVDFVVCRTIFQELTNKRNTTRPDLTLKRKSCSQKRNKVVDCFETWSRIQKGNRDATCLQNFKKGFYTHTAVHSATLKLWCINITFYLEVVQTNFTPKHLLFVRAPKYAWFRTVVMQVECRLFYSTSQLVIVYKAREFIRRLKKVLTHLLIYNYTSAFDWHHSTPTSDRERDEYLQLRNKTPIFIIPGYRLYLFCFAISVMIRCST